jgi:hypothetical protein
MAGTGIVCEFTIERHNRIDCVSGIIVIFEVLTHVNIWIALTPRLAVLSANHITSLSRTQEDPNTTKTLERPIEIYNRAAQRQKQPRTKLLCMESWCIAGV